MLGSRELRDCLGSMVGRAAALAFGLTTLVLVLLPETARSGGPITVYYMERPPYYVTEDGRAAGLLNVLAAEVLESANIPHRFAVLPPKRILEEIAAPGADVCSVGWLKTTERESFARFSLPIYRNLPMLPLARRDAAPLLQGRSLDDILADRSLLLGVLDGFSYGATVDELIAKHSTRIYSFAGTQKQLARMLSAGRVDYMLVSPEEVPQLIADSKVPVDSLSLVEVRQSPQGNFRHLMCSKSVPEDVMRRIDEAIARLGLPKGN